MIERGIALARRRGDRVWELSLTTNLVAEYGSGRWDEAERVVAEMPEDGRLTSDPVQASTKLDLAKIALYRGELARASSELAAEYAAWVIPLHESAGVRIWARATRSHGRGRHRRRVVRVREALRDETHNVNPEGVEVLFEVGCESAAWRETPTRWRSSSRSRPRLRSTGHPRSRRALRVAARSTRRAPR